MSVRIEIHHPEGLYEAADYVEQVAEQLREGYQSGHVSPGLYWEPVEPDEPEPDAERLRFLLAAIVAGAGRMGTDLGEALDLTPEEVEELQKIERETR